MHIRIFNIHAEVLKYTLLRQNFIPLRKAIYIFQKIKDPPKEKQKNGK